MPPLAPGVIAWADPCPGLRPPTPHPLIIAQRYATGALGVLYISHSTDLVGRFIQLTPTLVPTAFRSAGGPLTSPHSAVLLANPHGDRMMIVSEPIAPDSLRVGTATITLSRGVQLPPDEWKRLALLIRAGLDG